MRCPICNSAIDAKCRCCVKCGAFLKGKRNRSAFHVDFVDVNMDSLEVIAHVPGMTREDAIFIVKERGARGGFMNITEVVNYLGKSYEQMKELEKVLICTPLKNAPGAKEKKTDERAMDIPEEWGGYVGKIKTQVALKAKSDVSTKKNAPVAELIDINNDSEEKISTLPGVGVVLAKRIVRSRAEDGCFKNMADLAERFALKQYLVARIEKLLVFNDAEEVETGKPHGRVVDF